MTPLFRKRSRGSHSMNGCNMWSLKGCMSRSYLINSNSLARGKENWKLHTSLMLVKCSRFLIQRCDSWPRWASQAPCRGCQSLGEQYHAGSGIVCPYTICYGSAARPLPHLRRVCLLQRVELTQHGRWDVASLRWHTTAQGRRRAATAESWRHYWVVEAV
jgi:hypothetical protein